MIIRNAGLRKEAGKDANDEILQQTDGTSQLQNIRVKDRHILSGKLLCSMCCARISFNWALGKHEFIREQI